MDSNQFEKELAARSSESQASHRIAYNSPLDSKADPDCRKCLGRGFYYKTINTGYDEPAADEKRLGGLVQQEVNWECSCMPFPDEEDSK